MAPATEAGSRTSLSGQMKLRCQAALADLIGAGDHSS